MYIHSPGVELVFLSELFQPRPVGGDKTPFEFEPINPKKKKKKSATYRRCSVRERRVEVARVTVGQKVLYVDSSEESGRGRWVQGEGSREDSCE
jgi:hypothetical protein